MKQYQLNPITVLEVHELNWGLTSSAKLTIFKGLGFYKNPIRVIWSLFKDEEIINKYR